MNIILQNYKNLIQKIITDNYISKIDKILLSFNGINNINNYINLISNLDSFMADTMRISLINLLEELDNNFMNSIERKIKYHIKSHTSRTILTIFGEITYKRTFYSSKLTGKSFCYVDRLLGLKKYDYFDPYIKSEILDYVSEHNYSETAKHLNSLIGNRITLSQKEKYLSRQTIRNIILKARLSNPEIIKKKDVDILYIMADEKWIPTQRNNGKKVMQKSIVIFDGVDKTNKNRHKLKNKITFSGRNNDFIYDAIDYIESAYNISKIKTFYMLGDGATWIKNLKYTFNFNPNIQIIQALDKFHLKQCLWRILPEEDVIKTLLECIILNNQEDFKRLISEICDLNDKRKDKIVEYEKYILNNWTNILNLYKYELSCPMESQISHTFAAYFTSRPKGYSLKTLDKLIKLRLLKKNNYNIKELYLNNINSNKILTINQKGIDYSMFDTKETYSVILRTKRKHFGI